MILPSNGLGARCVDDGVIFSLYTAVAEAVVLCLYAPDGREVARHALELVRDGIWSRHVPGCLPGQRYGYRVHGPYRPAEGLRCNAHKLLIDPYARQLDGDLQWHDAVLGYAAGNPYGPEPCTRDSAPWVPKSVVTGDVSGQPLKRPRIPWRDTVICEINVRGYTMRHPGLSAAERGRFAGLSNGQILAHLRALGITSVELLPVHAFIDERFLHERGLRNYWGYNTVNFFAPAGRYAGNNPVAEFRAMTDAIHDAGMEVLLDVVYNHTAETDEFGPTLTFRGIDNQSYYRSSPDAPQAYINDTGCGNTLNADHPQVQALVLSSLEYWHNKMGVDGFRFDLATVLGRSATGFTAAHPLLNAIERSPALADAKLIAEPWDIGPGGYQLGRFGARWGEWNDRYRDTVRRFWRGDVGAAGEFARCLHGSAELFEHKGRGPEAGINFVTSHDGFTLTDVVSYSRRHNEVNGEQNRDGHAHNYSSNYGHEGLSEDGEINALRRQQRLNMLATLLISGGTPMLLGGDDIGHSQQGNNNAYAQDNEIAWLDWSGLQTDPAFVTQVGEWAALRRREPLLRPREYRHGATTGNERLPDIVWLRPDGAAMAEADWNAAQAFAMVLTAAHEPARRLAVLLNASEAGQEFALPPADADDAVWQLRLATVAVTVSASRVALPPRCVAVVGYG